VTVLVTDSQFQILLKEILAAFPGLRDRDDQYFRDKNLVVDFPSHHRLAPRFLAKIHSKNDYNEWIEKIPCDLPVAPGEVELEPPSQEDIDIFNSSSDICAGGTGKGKAKQTAGQKKRGKASLMLSRERQFKICQQYLGLRPKLENGMRLFVWLAVQSY